MRFVVKFRSGDSPTTNRYPHAVLVQDSWDDYGYKTTFHVTLHMSVDESYDRKRCLMALLPHLFGM